MNSKEFCEQVLKQLRYATAEEKRAIRQEMLDHIEDHANALKDAGYSQEEAGECALSAMGNPEQIGRELNKQYPLGWLVLSRAALMLIILLGVSLLMTLPLLGQTYESLVARIAPTKSSFVSTGNENSGAITYPLKIKVPIGNDTLSIYEAALQGRPNGGGYISIATCNYDRNPFGIASQFLRNNLKAETADGVDDLLSGGGGGNARAYYWTIRSLPVTRAEQEIYLTYDCYGE